MDGLLQPDFEFDLGEESSASFSDLKCVQIESYFTIYYKLISKVKHEILNY